MYHFLKTVGRLCRCCLLALPLAVLASGGERSTQARFAAAEKIQLVPVVAFYGPDGKRLTDPIIGTRLPDFCQSYLEQAIEKSVLALKTR